jgi:hypothetical protein
MNISQGVLFVAGMTLIQAVSAADRADLEGTQILGSRELPKVLYIVPWRPPVTGDLVGRPVESLLDEALAPVDREIFQRQVRFHGSLQARDGARSGK